MGKQKRKKKEKESRNETVSAHPSRGRNPTILSVFLIILIGFAVYGNSFPGAFIWDDAYLIEKNAHIKDWSYLPQIFVEDLGAGSGELESQSYRPLQTLTYMMDYSWWRLNPKGYHFTNTLLHVLAAVCLYYLIFIIVQDNLLALWTGLLFVVHPIHTQAVTYISGRADPLALLFMLLCFIFYVQRLSVKKASLFILMILSFTLALLSRENAIILPALLLLFHYSFKKRVPMKEFLSVVGVVLVYILLRVTVLKGILSQVSGTTTLGQRLPGFFVAITNYTRLLFLPLNLHMEYGSKLFAPGDIKAILGMSIFLALLMLALRKREKHTLVFFSIGWFFIAFLPVSNLYPLDAYMAEHWMYVPSIGFFLILATAIRACYRSKNIRFLATVLSVSLLAFYSFLTIQHNRTWRDPISFYERTLRYAPDSSMAAYNLGILYRSAGRNEEAIASFKNAVRIKPDYTEAYNNLGIAYAAANNHEEAISCYKKAIEINPNLVQMYNNLGIEYVAVDNKEKAVAAYKKAVKIDPDYAQAYNNLGVAYDAMGRDEDAIISYKEAIKRKPDFVEAQFNLGNIYRTLGKNVEAIASYKKAIEMRPDYIGAYYNLGALYSYLDRNNEAIAAYNRAIKINPNYARVYNNLSVIYFKKKQYKLAIEYCDKAKKLGYVNDALMEALRPYR